MERLAFQTPAGTLYARAAGPEDGPVVILLHGFPEFWYGWRHQIPALAEAGFRVVALDQRGYNESSKPPKVRDYALSELRGDVLAVADALGCERFFLAGHDWGGIVAWAVAMQHPERVRRMAILNAPHPAAARRVLSSSLRQMLRSWYVLFFQLPRIPEALFRARNYAETVRSLRASSAPGTFSDHDLGLYRQAWSHPGALTGMIHWYRALRHSRPGDVSTKPVEVPTRMFWGSKDRFMIPAAARESIRFCKNGELVELPNATHWVQHEEAERVNAGLIDWFRRA